MSDPFAPPRPTRDPVPSDDHTRSDRNGPWQDGKAVVAKHRVVWPRRCIRCNAPVGPATDPVRKELTWAPRWTLATALLGIVPYFFVYASFRQRGVVAFFSCERHATRRQIRLALQAVTLTTMVVGGLVATVALEQPGWMTLTVLGIVGWLVVPLDVVWARRIRGARLDVRGPDPSFLQSLPIFDESRALEAGFLDDGDLDPDL